MRPSKRARLIARSIAKMIEAAGGKSPELSRVVVRLPATVFDQLRRDGDQPITRTKIEGVWFSRLPDENSRKARSRKAT